MKVDEFTILNIKKRINRHIMRILKFVITLQFIVFSTFAQVRIEKPKPDASNQDVETSVINKVPRIEMFQLDNGLMVYLVKEDNRPEVFGAVAVRAGGKYDPADATGMGHYLEHMLFKGTQIMGTKDYQAEKPLLDSITFMYAQLKKVNTDKERKDILRQINILSVKASKYAIPNELDRLLQSIGSTGVNAFTSEESIVYHNSFPPNQIEKWLDIYSERFINPVFRLFQAELEIVYEEKNRAMDQFFYFMYEEFLKKLFKNHPYGQQDILGLPEHLKYPDLVKMYDYFETYNVANNMALVLVGDIDIEETKKLVTQYFGRWNKGEVPAYPEYKEEQFKGREFFKVRMSPVKIGVMAYRTVTAGDELKPVMDVVVSLLSNQNETGFFDELKQKNKILEAITFPLTYNDHGALITFFIPKIIGQSLGKAEWLITEQINRLAKGDFSEELLDAVKLELSRDFATQIENNVSVALNIVESFIRNENPQKGFEYAKRISMVTKQDVINFAQTFLGENKLVMHSKMGFPKKTKLDKPGFDPVIPEDGEAKSTYAKYFETIETRELKPGFIEAGRDVLVDKTIPNVTVVSSKNELNNIANLEIIFQYGVNDNPLLGLAAAYMNYIGSEQTPYSDLRKQIGRLGCTYNFSADANFLTISIQGIDNNISQVLALLGELSKSPKPEDAILKRVINDEIASRKINESQASGMGDAMRAYLLYGKNSSYLKRPTKKDLKSIKTPQLLEAFAKATQQPVVINYSGKQSAQVIAKIYSQHFNTPASDGRFGPMERERWVYNKPQVIFLNNKDAVQSQVYFYIQGKPHTSENEAQIEVFNSYFGGDMSALVFQEIREFRSLAYTAYARYSAPFYDNNKGFLMGFIGCQADKTVEAVSTMNDLIKNMPQKSERFPSIQNSLIQGLITSKPGFREAPAYKTNMLYKNQTEDPRKRKYVQYPELTFDDILALQQEVLKEGILTVAIVGNKKKINLEDLKKFGEIIEVKEADILNK